MHTHRIKERGCDMGKHIKEHERYLIEQWLVEKVSVKEIADRLGKHYTTIYQEIKKGTVSLRDGATWLNYDKYCADVAQRKTMERAQNKGRDLKIGHDYALAEYIEHLILDKRYSPYAVVQSIRKSGKFATDICETTLYHYIDMGLFLNISNKNLAIKGRRKQQHHGVRAHRPSYKKPPEKSIDYRPEHINRKDSYGHWEMDTVYSGKGKSRACLLVLTERKTLDEYLIKIKDRSCVSTVHALDRLEKSMGYCAFKDKFKSITCDNGVEFGDALQIERSCLSKGNNRTTVYFCHPYSSWERGSNENQNKLVRRWIYKGESISPHSPEQIQQYQDWINNYPRRKFHGMSANEYKASLGL